MQHRDVQSLTYFSFMVKFYIIKGTIKLTLLIRNKKDMYIYIYTAPIYCVTCLSVTHTLHGRISIVSSAYARDQNIFKCLI
jgi:hypothetical protein